MFVILDFMYMLLIQFLAIGQKSLSDEEKKINLILLDSSYVKNPLKVNKRTKIFTRKYQLYFKYFVRYNNALTFNSTLKKQLFKA